MISAVVLKHQVLSKMNWLQFSSKGTVSSSSMLTIFQTLDELSAFFLLYQNNIEGGYFSTLCLHNSGNPQYALKHFSKPANPVHSYLAGFWPRIILQCDHRDSFSFSLLYHYFLNYAARTEEEMEWDIFLMWWKFIPAKTVF